MLSLVEVFKVAIRLFHDVIQCVLIFCVTEFFRHVVYNVSQTW